MQCPRGVVGVRALKQSCDDEEAHRSFEMVGKHMQGHLATHFFSFRASSPPVGGYC
ncbi:hypothetical protein METHP14_40095 [Pseudomonas sp. P14-2025]